jgi:predicted transcriptional regulator
MDDQLVQVNTSMDPETRSRLEEMAKADERNLSAMVRYLINREWTRRQRAETVSAETEAGNAIS